MIKNPGLGNCESDVECCNDNELGISQGGIPEKSLIDKEVETENPFMGVLRGMAISLIKEGQAVSVESLGAKLEDDDPDLLDQVNTKMLMNVVKECELGMIV